MFSETFLERKYFFAQLEHILFAVYSFLLEGIYNLNIMMNSGAINSRSNKLNIPY